MGAAVIDRVPLPRRPGVRLSSLAFGAAPVGNLYRAIDDDDALATLDAAWAAGIRYVDTAPHYGLGLSERRVGAALAGRPRDELVISTKVGRLLVPSPQNAHRPDDEGFAVPAEAARRRDYSADGVRRSLEASLRRLGMDRVDVVFVHDPDEHWEQASREAVPTLCTLREEGVIGAVGVGMNSSAMLTRFVAQTDVDVVMCAGRYSLLEQPALADLLPLAQERSVGVVAAGVFNSGLLARPDVPDDATYDYLPAPPAVLDRARRLAQACRRHGTSLPAAAVHLASAHPAVVSVALGMGSATEVLADVALWESPPPQALWADLVAQGLLDPGVPT